MESKIIQKVTPNAYCREMVTTKKYDCDFKFYDQLSQELKALEMWDEYNVVQNIKSQVVHIKEMTVMHAKSLDEDETPDEKEVRRIAENIRQALISLDTSSIPKIVQKMDQTKGNSVTKAVIDEMATQQSGKYVQTITKLLKNAHNPQNRTENVLLVGLFYLLNNQNAQKMINTYKNLIQKSLQQLKKFKSQINAIPIESASEIVTNQKFITFVQGTKLIYKTTNSLYDVLRIISGQSNLKFKLSNQRSQINQCINHINQQFNSHILPIQEQSVQQIRRDLSAFVKYLRTKDEQQSQTIKNSFCSFCMQADNLSLVHNKIVHVNCWNVMKTLSTK